MVVVSLVSVAITAAVMRLQLPGEGKGKPFPPGGGTAASFWTSAPQTTDSKPLEVHLPTRKVSDFIESGEAEMLGWYPPTGAERCEPFAESQSLVRFLGGLRQTNFKPGVDPSVGDVVYRDDTTSELKMRWNLVWNRLDPYVNNSIHPIIVLDNVPYVFVKNFTPGAKYGQNMGPDNVTEYGGFIRTLLSGIVGRYGVQKTSTFWFRVGTEPNTQPGHWGDTNEKFIDMYCAVASAVEDIVPKARVGTANFGAEGVYQQQHWDAIIVPIVKGIVEKKARVDFVGISCYGRGNRYCSGEGIGVGKDDRQCEYDASHAAICDGYLNSLTAYIPGFDSIPHHVMEYGLQQNGRDIVDDDPGTFGAAWTLSTATVHAVNNLSRAYHWGFGDRSFANDDKCPQPLEPCGLYPGSIWVAAATSKLFGNSTHGHPAVILEADGRSTSVGGEAEEVVASGVARWGGAGGATLQMLVSAFSSWKTDEKEMQVTVAFDAPWTTTSGMKQRWMVMNRTTSTFDKIYDYAAQNGYLLNSSDINVYNLKLMLSTQGLANVTSDGARWLQNQRELFSPTSWTSAGLAQVTCDKHGSCEAALTVRTPTTVALWIAPGSA
eukprot:Hpha_TRINITY_DN22263_c0_g1::TRINITY_DN22263_c0_g1_i1::g.167034::m.167034/K01198/xynB; xylan 1,4-beta-xylosidase